MIFAFTSCSIKDENNSDISTTFTSQANVVFNDTEMICKISRTATNIACISIIQPIELQGITFSWTDNNYKVSYNELGYENNIEILPNNSFAQAIINVLNSIESKENISLVSSNDNTNTFNGTCSSGKFFVTVQKSNSSIKNIKLDEINLIIDFFD